MAIAVEKVVAQIAPDIVGHLVEAYVHLVMVPYQVVHPIQSIGLLFNLVVADAIQLV